MDFFENKIQLIREQIDASHASYPPPLAGQDGVLPRRMGNSEATFLEFKTIPPDELEKAIAASKRIIAAVLDYGDVVYGNASHSTLKTLDAVYHSALRVITGDNYGTHHCTLYNKVGWPALSMKRDNWKIVIYYNRISPPSLAGIAISSVPAPRATFPYMWPM